MQIIAVPVTSGSPSRDTGHTARLSYAEVVSMDRPLELPIQQSAFTVGSASAILASVDPERRFGFRTALTTGDKHGKPRAYTFVQRSALGSSGFSLASSRRSSLVRSSLGIGTVIVISTISSPRTPSLVADGTPFSRRRSFCPDCVPGGIFSRARPSIVGNFDFCSQRRFCRADWNRQRDVVAVAVEDWVVAGADDRVEISGDSAMCSSIAFTGQANALAVARACLDANFERFGLRDRAFTVAGRAGRQILSGAVAAGALHVELHASAGLRDLARTVALRTFAGSFESTLAVALRADILARDVETHDAAADRRPERDVDLIFEIGAGLGTFFGRRAPASAEDGAEDVAEAAAAS